MTTIGSLFGGMAGFVRANGRPIAIWMALYLIFAILMRLGLAPFYTAQAAAARAAALGLPAATPPFGLFLSIFVLMMLLMLVLYNAVFRAILVPHDRAAAYLRVGLDEVRLLGLALVLGLAFFLAIMAASFLVVLVGSVIALLLGASQASAAAIASLSMLAVWIVGIGFGVRFSLAAPLTLYHRKIAIGLSWRLTRTRFWTLLGANVVMAVGVIGLMLIITIPVMGPMLAAMGHPGDPEATRRLVELQAQQMRIDPTFSGIAWLLASSLVGMIAVVAFAALPAVAARQALDEALDRF